MTDDINGAHIIHIPVYLNVKVSKRAEDERLALRAYAYWLTPEGPALVRESGVKTGLNELRLPVSCRILGRKLIREPIVVNGTSRVIGERYRLEVVYEPTNFIIHVLGSDSDGRLYFGRLAVPLTPLNRSCSLEVEDKALSTESAEPVDESRVPAPGQNHNKYKWHAIYGVDASGHVYVEVIAHPPLELRFPAYSRLYYRVNGQWYREPWVNEGETKIEVYIADIPGEYDPHVLEKVKIKYKYWSYEYACPADLIIEEVYAVEQVGDNSWHWSAPRRNYWRDLQPGQRKQRWAYEGTQLSLESVSLTFTVLALDGRLLIVPVPNFHFKVERKGLEWCVINTGEQPVKLWRVYDKAFIKIEPER